MQLSVYFYFMLRNLGVMPPDEDHPCVNNSIYTNVGAAFSIFFAQ